MGPEWQNFELAQRASSVLIAVGYAIATIVIGTVVRRQRPDAWRGLLGWGIAGTVLTVGDLVLTRALTSGAAGADGDGTKVVRILTVYFIVYAFAQLGLIVFLARCLVRLAQPAKRVEVEGSPPYR